MYSVHTKWAIGSFTEQTETTVLELIFPIVQQLSPSRCVSKHLSPFLKEMHPNTMVYPSKLLAFPKDTVN